MLIQLHNHSSGGSLLDGLSKPEQLAKRAKELGMPAVALTEHGTMYSAVKFYKACKKAEVNPILGCEVYSCSDRTYKEKEVLGKYNHLILLAKNEEGYHNIVRIVSDASLTGFYGKPRTDLGYIREHGKGIIATSACRQGLIPQLLLQGKFEEAENTALEMANVFDEFYLEIEASDTEDQYLTNQLVVNLAHKLKLPLVATNDSHYIYKEDGAIHEVLLAMQTSTVMSDPKRFKLDSNCYWFKTEEETRDYLKLSSISQEAIDESINNTVKIAEQCNVELPLGRVLFPAADIPIGKTAEEHLRDEAQQGLDRLIMKYDLDPEVYYKRFEYELGIIKEAQISAYFLIVQDLYKFIKERKIPRGPGRGSAAGSLIAWCLDITQVDPIKHKLSFERFYCPGRIGLPDIDMDISQARRKELFQYVIDKYGVNRCCHIITFGTLGAKTVIRDIGRTLEIPLVECDTMAKLIPEMMSDDDTGDKIDVTLEKTLEDSEELRGWKEKYPYLFEVAEKLEGNPRHTSMHAAGIVVAPSEIFGDMPLIHNKSEEDHVPISQFDMGDLEEYGYVKLDFLGLATTDIIDNTLKNIQKNKGIDIDLLSVSLEDKNVYDLICDLKTYGTFQFSTNVMKGMCSQVQPENFNALVDIEALSRPGPMKSGQDKEYVLCKVGIKKIEYLHPDLEPILGSTYGQCLYQEQTMRITQVIAGFDYKMADKFRKGMAKKKPEIIAEIKDKFLHGAAEVGKVTEEQAQQLWDILERFAGYGFNLSHSVSYGLITYWTTWLKVYYPTEFMAAVLTNEYAGNAKDRDDKIMEAMFECRNLNVKILPPNINESKDQFEVIDDSRIRFPINGAKGVGDKAMYVIMENAPYSSFQDFIERVPKKNCNKRVVQILILAGAFDSFNPNRLELMSQFFASRKEDYDPVINISKEEKIKLGSTYEFADMLEWERIILGAYISGHPLDPLNLAPWKNQRPGSTVTVAGKIFSHRKIEIKRGASAGKDMAICNIDTKEGQLAIVLFADAYEKYRDKIRKNNIIRVTGKLDERNGEQQVVANTVTIAKLPVAKTN